jgi:phosphatidylserine/phosphatidylglycerophosphate/cardiolipin synthase-like enzyme
MHCNFSWLFLSFVIFLVEYFIRITMSLSKIAKFAAIGAGLFVFGEIYYECVKLIKTKLRLRDDLEDLNEVICTNSSLNYQSKLIGQIVFRDPDERAMHVAEVLKNLVLSARKTIHVAMYIFTSNTLGEALKTAHAGGVEVYVLVDKSMEAASATQIKNLIDQGIHVKICHDNTMHHKFCLIDVPTTKNRIFVPAKKPIANDKPRQVFVPNDGILINGSLNWTKEGLTNNYENIIVTSNKALIAGYVDEFVARWYADNARQSTIT